MTLSESDFPPLGAVRSPNTRTPSVFTYNDENRPRGNQYGMSSIRITGEKLQQIIREDEEKEAERRATAEMKAAEFRAINEAKEAERRAKAIIEQARLDEEERQRNEKEEQQRRLKAAKIRRESIWTRPALLVPTWNQLAPVMPTMHSYDTRSPHDWETRGCAHAYYVPVGKEPCFKCPTCAILLRATPKEVLCDAKKVIAIVCGVQNSMYRHFEDLIVPPRRFRGMYDDDFDYMYVDKSPVMTYYCIEKDELSAEAVDIARRRFVAAHQQH